ncbi:MAG: hypothetical protein M3Y71_03270, partial [Actinomycetota bacterium]|nr:hypothetical protein [Actinomycetota bacterium]
HLHVVRGLPWGLAAALLVVVAVALPRPEGAGSVGAGSGEAAGPTTLVTPTVGVTSLPRLPSASRPSIRLGPVQGTKVDIVVRSPRPTGPLEIRTRIGDDEISYPLVSLGAARDLTVVVNLPESGRFIITLNDLTSTTPLQTLVVER